MDGAHGTGERASSLVIEHMRSGASWAIRAALDELMGAAPWAWVLMVETPFSKELAGDGLCSGRGTAIPAMRRASASKAMMVSMRCDS